MNAIRKLLEVLDMIVFRGVRHEMVYSLSEDKHKIHEYPNDTWNQKHYDTLAKKYYWDRGQR